MRLYRGRVLAAVALSGAAIAAATLPWTAGPDGRAVTLDLGGPLVYRPLPPFMADLMPFGGRTPFVRLVIVVQAPETVMAPLDEGEVEIMAAIQAHLRGLTRRSLVGHAGAERLRADLREIINRTIQPAEIRTVYLTEILLD